MNFILLIFGVSKIKAMFIFSKFKSRCNETGATINKGELIYYSKGERKAYCERSDRFKEEQACKHTADMIRANENAYFDNFCRDNNI